MTAGAASHRAYAQAQSPSRSPDAGDHGGHHAIGRVEKVVGDVTVLRHGMTVTQHVGDAVYKSDVIQTGNASSVGISFSDGSAVHLAANTRIAINEYPYDTDAGANAAAFTLIEGTFGFVAGKLVHGGDMKISTPVGTMSVRDGTSGWAHQLTPDEASSISAKLGGLAYAFAVVDDRADHAHGLYDLMVDNAVVGSVSDPHLVSYLDQQGNLITLPLDSSRQFADALLQDLVNDTTPGALLGIHGSGSAIDAPTFPQGGGAGPGVPSFVIDFNTDCHRTGRPDRDGCRPFRAQRRHLRGR